MNNDQIKSAQIGAVYSCMKEESQKEVKAKKAPQINLALREFGLVIGSVIIKKAKRKMVPLENV